MKKLKKFSFAIVTILLISSCVDPCKDINCLNGGTCLEGVCLCPDFYEGTDCAIEERSNYFGSYTGTTTYSDSQGNSNTYVDSKTVSSNSRGVAYIKFDGDIYALLSDPGSGAFTIPSQTSSNPVVSNSYFSGSGNCSSTYLSYTITSENNGETLIMSFTGTK